MIFGDMGDISKTKKNIHNIQDQVHLPKHPAEVIQVVRIRKKADISGVQSLCLNENRDATIPIMYFLRIHFNL